MFGKGADIRCLERDEVEEASNGGVGETQERTCVAIAPRMDGCSLRALEGAKGTDWVETGVAREDSVKAESTEDFPILSASPKRDMDRAAAMCCWGAKMGWDGEG